MSPNYPYIPRKRATKFAQGIKDALDKPERHSLLHYASGIGGIGKTTLLGKVAESYGDDCQCIQVSCDQAVNQSIYIDSPIKLMEVIDRELSGNVFLGSSPFQKIFKQYQQTLSDLEDSPIEGEEQVTPEQIAEVKKLARVGAKGIGFLAAAQSDGGIVSSRVISPIAERAADFVVDASVVGLTAYDLLKKHNATKNKPELQELVENPIPQFAKAIIQTLIKKSQAKPILLFIDTYEKATPDFDTFLCTLLLSDDQLRKVPFRIIMAGRYPLSNKKYNRLFQRQENAISEIRLDKFDKSGTEKYLKDIGITESKQIDKIWKATKGYPYYLNLIRKQKNSGKEIKLSRGGQDMVELLLDDLSDIERKVVCLAAYCRRFDHSVIEYLIEQNNIEQKPEQDNSWFNWLVNRDFTINEESHRFDDVARDVIRQAEHNNDRRSFYKIHQQLFQYFQQLANETVATDELVNKKYEDPEWCEYAIESTYHALYADKKQGQIKLLTHFFEGAYLKEPEVAIESFNAVISETISDELKLLPGNTKSFLKSTGSAIMFGWIHVGDNPERYEITLKSEETATNLELGKLLKDSIELALGKCFKEVENLEGIAKCFGLIGKYVRSNQIKQDLVILDLAEVEIEKIGFSKYPKLSNIIFRDLGVTKYKLGRYEEALTDCNRAIELDSNNSNAWMNCGVIKDNLGRHEEALIDYNRAIELDSNNSDAWMNRGAAKYELGRYEEALTDCNRAIELDSNNSDAWMNRGVAKDSLGRYEEALTDYNRAIELDSNNYNAWMHRGNTKGRLGRYEEALTDYNRAIELDPDNSDAWNIRALNMSVQGKFEQAISDIHRAIALSPKKVIYIVNKGIILARKSDFNQAKECIEQSESMNSDREYIYYARACYFALQNKEQDAIKNLKQAIAIAPFKCKLEAKHNPDFDRLRDNPEFKALINN